MAWNCVRYQIITEISLRFTYCLGQMLGCDEEDSSLATGHGGMVSVKHFLCLCIIDHALTTVARFPSPQTADLRRHVESL